MWLFLADIAITLSLSVLFLAVGSLFSKWIGFEDRYREAHHLRLGLSFFLGLSAFLSVWAALARVAGARLSLYAAVAAMTLCLVWQWKKHLLPLVAECRRELLIWLTVVLAAIALGTLKALNPLTADFLVNPAAANPFAGFTGVGHSFRAANISLYIFAADRIPALNQNVGQSMLGATQLLFGIMSPQAALAVWLNSVLAAGLLFSWGLVKLLVRERAARWIGFVFLVCGASVLPISNTSIVDTESTLLLSDNINSLASIFCFVLFLLILLGLLRGDLVRKNKWAPWAAIALLAFSWNLVGAQNLILALGIAFLPLLLTIRNGSWAAHASVAVAGVLIGGAVLGLPFGGMLTPAGLTDTVTIPGVMSVRQPGEPLLALRPFRLSEGNSYSLDQAIRLFRFGAEPLLSGTVSPQPSAVVEPPSAPRNWRERLKQNELTFTVARIGRSLQLMFYPVLGLCALAYLARREKRESAASSDLRALLLGAAVPLFGVGVIISSSFKLYGYYWELPAFFTSAIIWQCCAERRPCRPCCWISGGPAGTGRRRRWRCCCL